MAYANEWKGETDNEAEDLPYRQRRVAEGVPSDLNNLKDISMRRDYIDICGITDKELHRYFDKDLHTLADVLKCRNATTDIISISTRPAFTILSACSILLMQWRSAVIGLPQALLLILSTY